MLWGLGLAEIPVHQIGRWNNMYPWMDCGVNCVKKGSYCEWWCHAAIMDVDYYL